MGLNIIQEFNPLLMKTVGRPFKFDYSVSHEFSACYVPHTETIFMAIPEIEEDGLNSF